MRAADNSIRHYHALYIVLLEESRYLVLDLAIVPNIRFRITNKSCQDIWFPGFRFGISHSYFRRDLVGRTIERDRRQGVASKSLLGFLLKPLSICCHLTPALARRNRQPMKRANTRQIVIDSDNPLVAGDTVSTPFPFWPFRNRCTCRHSYGRHLTYKRRVGNLLPRSNAGAQGAWNGESRAVAVG